MQTCDTIICASHILGETGIIENGAIAIKAGVISALGPEEAILRQWIAENTFHMGRAAVIPGLVNAHTHAAMTFLRGFADDLPLMEWLTQKVFPVEGRLTREIVRLGSLLGYAEMLASGTTSCIDMYIFEDAVFEAAEMAGIRCMGGEAVFGFPSAACQSAEEALDKTESLAAKYRYHPRISVAVNPHSVYTTDGQILRKCRDLALKLDLPVHIHLAETKAETARSLELHKMRPIAFCEEKGLFDARVIAAHLVDVTEDEAAFLAKKKVVGVHNPTSNMKLASGVSPVMKMRKAGMNVALGTDGPASNNSLNIFKEMGMAALLHKLANGDPQAVSAPQALEMATKSGALALGNERLGALKAGNIADLAVINLDLPHLMPLYNLVSQLVYAAGGHECRLAMVGGQVVYKDGEYAFDYEGLRREAVKLREFALKSHA